MVGDCDDQALVAAVRGGDDRAFERLYERYHRRIAAYVQGMVKDHARAEDITQDVFMSALRRMRETDRPIAFKPWVYEIAKNACIDQFRRSRRAEEVSYDADDGLGAHDHGRLVGMGPTPDVAVDHKLSLENLRGAFGGLSETHHEILVMREFEGLSYREIGERLGMSRPAVESTLFRARRRLTEEYAELVSGERCLRVQAIIGTAHGRALGARDNRRIARHVSHCQPCRRHARAAGLDATLLTVPQSVRAKVAAILPIPAFLRLRRGGDADTAGMASSGHAGTLAQWSAQAGSALDPSVASWAKAAVAAVTIAAAGVGAGAGADHGARAIAVDRDAHVSASPAASVPAVVRAGRRVSSVAAAARRASSPALSAAATHAGTPRAGGRSTGATAGQGNATTPSSGSQAGAAPSASSDLDKLVGGGVPPSGSGTAVKNPVSDAPDLKKVLHDVAPGVRVPPVPPAGQITPPPSGDAATKAGGAIEDAASGVKDAVDGILHGG